MLIIIVQFIVVYFILLITFSSVASMTLSESPNFSNLFNSTRMYLMASLGNFDILQYDDLPGWKMYYGIFMHVAVLFLNMILLLNLLIAIMSDEYAALSNVRVGLYWGSVINEMPKYVYNKKYGSLTMFPFIYSWLSLIVMPFLICISDSSTLQKINHVAYIIVYAPISLVILLVFMCVNLILLPFAYLMTVVHKVILLRRYRSKYQFQALLSFLTLGIPLLIAS